MTVLIAAVNGIGQLGLFLLVHERNTGDLAHIDLHRIVLGAGHHFGVKRDLACRFLLLLGTGAGDSGSIDGLAAAFRNAFGNLPEALLLVGSRSNRLRGGPLRHELGRRSFNLPDQQLALRPRIGGRGLALFRQLVRNIETSLRLLLPGCGNPDGFPEFDFFIKAGGHFARPVLPEIRPTLFHRHNGPQLFRKTKTIHRIHFPMRKHEKN